MCACPSLVIRSPPGYGIIAPVAMVIGKFYLHCAIHLWTSNGTICWSWFMLSSPSQTFWLHKKALGDQPFSVTTIWGRDKRGGVTATWHLCVQEERGGLPLYPCGWGLCGYNIYGLPPCGHVHSVHLLQFFPKKSCFLWGPRKNSPKQAMPVFGHFKHFWPVLTIFDHCRLFWPNLPWNPQNPLKNTIF